MPRIVVQAALALPYAARNLDAEAAAKLRATILAAEDAIRLAQLEAMSSPSGATPCAHCSPTTRRRASSPAPPRGCSTKPTTSGYKRRRISCGACSPRARRSATRRFLRRLLRRRRQRLIHDAALRGAVDDWLMGLEREAFTASLPLFAASSPPSTAPSGDG
jgi:hypothetical protein